MLTLVIGGAASGKSEYAESLVLRSTLPRYYLATMQVWDAECAARVEKHRRMRAAKQFETVECPLHLDAVHLPARGTAITSSPSRKSIKRLKLVLPTIESCKSNSFTLFLISK